MDIASVVAGGGLAVFAAFLLRLFTQVGGSQQTLLDRYQADISARDARIDSLEAEIVNLRQALDELRREVR